MFNIPASPHSPHPHLASSLGHLAPSQATEPGRVFPLKVQDFKLLRRPKVKTVWKESAEHNFGAIAVRGMCKQPGNRGGDTLHHHYYYYYCFKVSPGHPAYSLQAKKGGKPEEMWAMFGVCFGGLGGCLGVCVRAFGGYFEVFLGGA